MFSSLKFSTLRTRARSKDMAGDVNPENRCEEDEPDISCAPSFKCQQPFNKCSIGKACGKQNAKGKHCTVKSTEQEYSPHSDVFLPVEKYCNNDESMYVTIKKADVFIERDEEGNLGLTLQGGVHQNPQFSRPLVVTHITPGGPTDKEGTIQIGDRLLAIDGFPLNNVTISEAYNILCNSNNQSSSRLTIEYDVTNMKTFSGPLLVEMESPHPHQLGLTLTNTPHNAAVLIDEIKTASIAERCGALHPGDQILSVNDTRIEGSRMPATEVYKLLRICGGTHSNLLLQILPASAFAQSQIESKTITNQYSPKTETSFDVYHNYYEVPNEYLVPSGVLHNEPVCKSGKVKRLAVTLHSDDRLGYGLSIFSSPKIDAPVISSISPGGPADLCECLQINDRILSINGMPIAGITSEPQPLHRVPGVALGMIEIEVEYDEYKPYVTSADNTVTVELTKYNKKNLGITMTGSSECMLISDVKPGSVADRCGMLEIGDKILSINHQVLAKCSVQEALSILHSSSDIVSLQIEKQIVEAPNYESIEYTVQLNKQNGPIGITITGSEITPRKITISALTPGGLAEKTGALHVGDRVLEIDNHDVHNVLLTEAITILQNTGDKVLFKVSRNSPNFENFTDDVHNRIYGSPGLVSDDSAVESWESSTQRDVSPNDTPFQHIQQHISEYKQESEPCNEHILPNVIIPQNNVKMRLDEPLYSNVPYQGGINQYTLPYYNRIPFHENYKILSNIDNRNQRVLMSSSYADNYDNTFSNVDEIFSIADFHDNEINKDSTSKVHQVVLYKDPLYEDFGFSISDGLYERGVFINRIRQGGPADKHGLLQPFDRIIQVNNTRTEDFDCCLTVPLIAAADEKITLTVKRKNRATSVESRNRVQVVPWIEKANPEKRVLQKLNTTHTI